MEPTGDFRTSCADWPPFGIQQLSITSIGWAPREATTQPAFAGARVSNASGLGAGFQHIDQAVARTYCRLGTSLDLLSSQKMT